MRKLAMALAVVSALVVAAPLAHGNFGWLHQVGSFRASGKHERFGPRVGSFQRVSTLGNYLNRADIGDTTVSEIVAATANGRTLVYTDSPGLSIGFIDISNPRHPAPDGTVLLDPDPDDDIDYEPTSVDVLGNRSALVAVNTSESLTNPSGSLFVVDIVTRTIVGTVALGGQPDSVQVSPDGRYVAVAIENERDETLVVDGVEGGLPQTPANPPGYLVVLKIVGLNPAAWIRHDVELTGLATYAPEDPEPEFVDINSRNEAVVTLQENNHIVIVDLESHAVVGHFPAGAVTLTGVDATEDGVISLTETIVDVPREPDAVAWVPGRRGRLDIATANEGDLFGGSRGFSTFRRNGRVAFDSGTSLEEVAVRHGHYPESRSENKGTEPEAIEYGRFGEDDYLFVGSERGSFVAVYEIDRHGRPRFVQLLPAPLAPEGLLAIPGRNLFVAAGEEDDPSFGVRSTVMIYELKRDDPTYPQILSDDRHGSPIPWSALSGMASVPWRPDSLLAVWDSYYSESRILHIDVSEKPAVVTDSRPIQGGGGNYDPEGIALAPDRTIWIASEGNASDSRPNLLLQLDAGGNVLAEIGLPQAILDCRAASTAVGTLGSGFEGVAVLRSGGGKYRLVVAQQRGWDYTTLDCEDLDDDGGGVNGDGEPHWTRIWIYDPWTNTWDHVAWELAPKPAHASWVGLSEITETPNGDYILIERDNRTGDFAGLKTLVKVDRHAGADGLVSHSDKSVYDLLPALRRTNGWITDKPEGVAVTPYGHLYVSTDNDGVEDWSGETWFFGLGRYWWLF